MQLSLYPPFFNYVFLYAFRNYIVYLSANISVHLSVYLFVHLSVYLSIHLSVHISVHLSFYLHFHVYYVLLIYPFIYLLYYFRFTHPDWDHNTLENDIALIELPEPITFNDYIKPSCLPSKGSVCAPPDMVSVIGWGKPSDAAQSISPTLQMVHDIPVMTNDECNDYYGIIQDGKIIIQYSYCILFEIFSH